MKYYKKYFNIDCLTLALLFIIFSIITPALTYAYEKEPLSMVTIDGCLTIRSFSENWDEESLYMVYDELRNNFNAGEFKSLSRIDLYPGSGGVLGNYYEDFNVDENGRVFIGDNCYIEIYNMDKYAGIEDLAPVLSHEYGHHYTIYNMVNYEGKYYAQWADSEYAKIRELDKYDISYINDSDYEYINDIAEIAAGDYVQLLGSYNARQSYDYKDAVEALAEGESQERPVCFNMKPQKNISLPLATEVSGLYEYFLKIVGYTYEAPKITKNPEIINIEKFTSSIGDSFVLSFTHAENKNRDIFEYTVVMYPEDFPQNITPVKTLNDGEELKAIFGALVYKRPDDTLAAVLDSYSGKYVFKVYAKDHLGYIFSSNGFTYDLGNDIKTANVNLMKKNIKLTAKGKLERELPVISLSRNIRTEKTPASYRFALKRKGKTTVHINIPPVKIRRYKFMA